MRARSVPSSPARAVAPNGERYVIPNLRNACRILKELGRHADGLKAAELARTLRVPVTTTLRIMTTLHLEGLVRKTAGRYELGPVLIPLGQSALAGTEIRELARPLLEQLTAETSETSHLAVPCDGRSLIVAVQDSPHPLRAASRPGFFADLHCSGTGKVFLAHVYREQVSALAAAGLARRTPRTLTSATELKREVALVLKRGYGVDDEEYHAGVRCLAAPVFDSDGKVVAALGITASAVRFPKQRLPEIARRVGAVAAELSRRLGFAGPQS